jgi:arabinogalactan oligomer/maltooligosaccharide transport system substrate-binding protein
MRRLFLLLTVFFVAVTFVMASGEKEGGGGAESAGPVTVTMWTQEGEAEDALQFVEDLANTYSEQTDGVTIEVLQKGTEVLREDFLTASLANNAPDLLWTVNDHAGPFIEASAIQPVGEMFDMSKYVEAVSLEGKTWGVPISSGNHLMLMYNKSIVSEPPENTEELIEMGKQYTSGEQYGLVYNAVEPFWLVPWLGGFEGQVFEEGTKEPNLNTEAMVQTLDFVRSLEFEHGIVPKEADYSTMDSMFKEGKAAMIINGDWALGTYRDALGEDFGVARIPKVQATGEWPKPYTSGKYFMIGKNVSGAKLEAVKDFVSWVTNYENQIKMVETLTRLPGLREALDAEEVTSDPILEASAKQMEVGVPMPAAVEMRAVWDAMKPEMNAVLSGSKDPEQAAADMQKAAEQGVEDLAGE